jgi:hypothetical protein
MLSDNYLYVELFLRKLTVAQLVRECPASYETRILVAVFTTVHKVGDPVMRMTCYLLCGEGLASLHPTQKFKAVSIRGLRTSYAAVTMDLLQMAYFRTISMEGE